ncbi:hypothetical protein N0V90_012213 [Kalmusia sp. IMI 367209]|nr:hypothetical protein N0V90_012213 [Kalmusia sp. IMI 367209]
MMKTEAGTPSYNGSGYMDDEFFEDTGELQLPRSNPDVTLTRIPEWLYEHISNWDQLAQGNDNDQIVIGEVLALPERQSSDGKPQQPPSMRLFLNDAWRERSGLPTAFELEGQQVNNDVLQNTYIFTEKDLPGFRPNGVGQNKSAGGFGAVQDPKARVNKRSKYKKAIPKQTALIGSSTRQYLAKPLNTADYIAFTAKRNKQAIQGANARTEILHGPVDEISEMNNAQTKFSSFIKSTTKPKSQTNKASRISRNELLDILHAAFDEYAYWPMKALKAKTKQPEAFLKEELPHIAQLIKSGPFASCWHRLSTFARAEGQQQMPDMSGIKSEDEEDDEEMEDVPM